MSPKVSIIIPVYNVSSFIERCACSLFEQTFDDIEFIFVNDFTPDNSIHILEKVIERYPRRKSTIKIINHEINKGLSAARNTGLGEASGDYILHVDSDDYIELDMTESMVNKAIETNADIVVCDHYLQWNKVSRYCPQKYSTDGVNYTKMLLAFDVTPNVWNKLVKKSLYTKENIRSVEGVDTGEDYLLIPRLAYYAKVIAKVDAPFYHYMQTNRNSYMKNYSHKSIISLIKVLEILNNFFETKNDKELYRDALVIGRLKIKILMLKVSSYKARVWISNLYPETNSMISKVHISLQGKITLYLAKMHLFIFLGIFLFTQRFFSEILETLKGRRF